MKYTHTNKELILFLHIAKTGGTTLRTILDKQYDKHSLSVYPSKQDIYLNTKEKTINTLKRHINFVKSISGHFDFEMWYDEFKEPLLKLIPTTRKITYITLLRKPSDRIFSQFHHYKRNNWIDSQIDFKQFIEEKMYTLNYQTTCISGKGIPNLTKAKINILNSFSLVGITERFSESLFLMNNIFKWKNIKYVKKNKYVSPCLRNTIPIETIKLLEQDNHLDMELYKFAETLLQHKINNLTMFQKQKIKFFSPFY
ncbi:hypothetical protein [Bacillus sp. FSL R12-0069]|uniref:hypothetical protein n=1 Tax=Bacillus sp. FSL R12-0069 TaxID=2975342 RepID=UPI0030F90760